MYGNTIEVEKAIDVTFQKRSDLLLAKFAIPPLFNELLNRNQLNAKSASSIGQTSHAIAKGRESKRFLRNRGVQHEVETNFCREKIDVASSRHCMNFTSLSYTLP